MQILQTNVRVITGLIVISMTAACDAPNPNWEQKVHAHLAGQGQTPYVRVEEVSSCRARGDGERQQVRCQMTVTLTENLTDIEAQRGSAEESITVAELTHRFGRFQAGDQRQLPVTLAFQRRDGAWRVSE